MDQLTSGDARAQFVGLFVVGLCLCARAWYGQFCCSRQRPAGWFRVARVARRIGAARGAAGVAPAEVRRQRTVEHMAERRERYLHVCLSSCQRRVFLPLLNTPFLPDA